MSIEGIQSDSKELNLGLIGSHLMFSVEGKHQANLEDLNGKQEEINAKLGRLQRELKAYYKHLKSDSKEPLDMSKTKESVLDLWNEWRNSIKERDEEEYKTLSTDLEKLDFSKLTNDQIEKTVISELESVQRHFEFKYGQIPNQLRLFIELFTILAEILKEFPKKHAELNGHISRNVGKG